MSAFNFFSNNLVYVDGSNCEITTSLKNTRPSEQKTFTAPSHTVDTNNLLVFLDGNLKIKNVDYTDDNSTEISFKENVPTTSDVVIILVRASNPSSSAGGGGEPDEYLKKANYDSIGRILTITDKEDRTVVTLDLSTFADKFQLDSAVETISFESATKQLTVRKKDTSQQTVSLSSLASTQDLNVLVKEVKYDKDKKQITVTKQDTTSETIDLSDLGGAGGSFGLSSREW